MQTQTETRATHYPPANVPDGIEVVGGKQYMTDAQGKLVPLEMIKAENKLEDEEVRKVIGHAIALEEQIQRFKAHCMEDLANLDALLEQNYGFVKRGNKGKGNRTYMSVDGLFKVTVQVADYIDFGPQLQIAKQLLDECLNEWAADSRPEIRTLVTRAFNTDKQGQINRAEIFTLLRLDSEDHRWQQAMNAIRDAMRVVGSKEYVRFAMRSSNDMDWKSIQINLAKA